jgi:thiosulfate/3-mercaptopyruvate sulfurtransferase
MTRVLISPEELKTGLADGTVSDVLDVRWSLESPDGRDAFRRGHIPGSRYVSLDDELSDLTVKHRGRHPLPSPDRTADFIDRLDTTGTVVVYDDWLRAGSSRAWWVLTSAGVENVRVLDGGLASWTSVSVELETGPGSGTGLTDSGRSATVRVEPVDPYSGKFRPVIAADELDAFVSGGGVLLDARARARYLGEHNPVGEVPGHIPGARSQYFADVLDEHGFFRSPTAIRALLHTRGVEGGRPAAAYCGSGVTASVVIAAARSVDIEVALFPGSWSQWSTEADRPVQLIEN